MNQQFAQVFKQLQTIWSQLGLNQRITIVATTLAVTIGVGTLAFWSSRPSYSLLFGRMDEAEAAKVIAYLDEAKIPYEVSRGSGTIKVPADKVHTTRMQLAAKGIPRAEGGVGFEIFDQSNFGISDFVQRKNYLRAVQGELSRTVSQVESVESARVMIVMPENRLMISDKNKPTASVFVKVRSNTQLPQPTVNAIRFLVANAVEGLTPANVSVVDNLGNVLSDSLEPDSVVGLTQTQLEVRKKLENYLAKKAESMLHDVLGPGQVVVRVAAEMDFNSMTQVREVYDPEGQVMRSATINEEDTASLSASPASVAPGVQVNAYGETNTVANAPQNNNKTRKKVTNNQYEINKTTSNMIQAAGTVTRISAAVLVASRVDVTNGVRTVTPRSAEELAKLKKLVQNALGIVEPAEGSTRRDEITLEEFEFNNQPGTEIATTFQREQTKQFWLQVGQTALYPTLALGVIALLWRVFKRTPDLDIPLPEPEPEPFPAINRLGTGVGNGKPGSPRAAPGVVTVDVLNQLIRENPQNMTQAIRGWMSRGPSK
jgi:flagellar M-ring protein FliF